MTFRPTPNRSARPAALAFALLFVPGLRAAQWPPAPELLREPESLAIPQDATAGEEALSRHPGVAEFLRKAPSWKATIDPLAGGVDRAFGEGVAAGTPPAEGDDAGRRFLEAHREMFAPGLDLSDESLPAGAAVQLPDPGVRLHRFDVRAHGIPVLGAGVTLASRDGRVFFVATSALAPVATSPRPSLNADRAIASLVRYLGDSAPSLVPVREPALAYYPRVASDETGPRLRHHLVWILETRPAGSRPWEAHFAYVDAHDGEVLALFPEARSLGACDADPAQFRGSASGGVRANRADDPERRMPMPFAKVSVDGALVSTDLNGRFPYPGATASSSLDGDFFRTHCDSCSTPVSPAASADPSGLVDFGLGGSSGGVPVTGNGASTPADRTTYFQLNEARLLLQKWNNAFFTEVDAFVNINSTCNAFSSGHMLGFFRAGGNCRNTGEIRDVVQHELGHTWDRLDGTGISNGGLSEWKGDVLALLMGGDSCAGESFFVSGGPSATCSGVRDLDEKAAGRTDHPATPAVCPTCATITRTSNNCGGGVHCTGEIPGQASWHLLQNLRTGADYITGVPFPAGNGAMSAEQARWILERLLIGGGPAMQTWDPTAAGVSSYDAILLADDEDGNLANGTPNAAYINAAFAHHGLTESPAISDSAACPALADPAATASLDRDPATGLPLVRLAWTPSPGTTYDVLRNTRAGDAFLPLAQNVSGGPVVDAGVQAGTTYRYFVAAVRKSGCAAISSGADVLTVTVASPELRITGRLAFEAATGADGDGLIEPGERVRIEATVSETGGSAGATQASATLVASDPAGAPVVSGGPASLGDIPAGGTASGPASFEALIGPSVPCGGMARYLVPIRSDDGCWLDGVDVPVSSAAGGCVGGAAFVEVVPGSAAVVSSGGDSDSIADNCETTTVAYRLRNAGTETAHGVSSTVATTHPGVTLSPRPECSFASLAGGSTADCQFSFSLGAAGAAGVPFTLSATSGANAAPSTLGIVLPTEQNAPTFTTVVYGFDSGFQGWSPQGFGLSFRSFSGGRSVHAGSTGASNLCTRITSPALLLSPDSPATLTLRVQGEIEPLSDQWYDRANVHLVDVAAGTHTVLVPASGLAYNAFGVPDGGLCHVPGESGWAGSIPTWSLASFDLAPWSGRRVRVEVNYSTDEGDDRDGIYLDDVRITNAYAGATPADAQGDSCTVPEVSAPAAPEPLRVAALPASVLRWSWQDVGPAFQYSLYAGTLGVPYDHGSGAVVCQGRGAGVVCDGTSCSYDQAALPPGDLYFLVTATGFGTEGTAGLATAGERDPAQRTCAP